MSNIINLASRRALRAVAKDTLRGVELVYIRNGTDLLQDTTYAHVLNSGAEEFWPGDINVFYPELFACRLSGVDYLYDDNSYLAEHKRCETQRRCQPYFERIAYFDYDFFRALQGSFPCDVVMAREQEIVDGTDWILDSPPQGREY